MAPYLTKSAFKAALMPVETLLYITTDNQTPSMKMNTCSFWPKAATSSGSSPRFCIPAASTQPHILELGYLGNFNRRGEFVDFETTQSAVPFYTTMRPYDRVLFQWSCHTMLYQGAPLEHREWLHDHEAGPNVTIGKTLARCLGNEGTP